MTHNIGDTQTLTLVRIMLDQGFLDLSTLPLHPDTAARIQYMSNASKNCYEKNSLILSYPLLQR